MLRARHSIDEPKNENIATNKQKNIIEKQSFNKTPTDENRCEPRANSTKYNL